MSSPVSPTSPSLSHFMSEKQSRVITGVENVGGNYVVVAVDPETRSRSQFDGIPESLLRPYVMNGRLDGTVNKEALVWSQGGAGIVIDSAAKASRSMSTSSAEGIIF
ncbi:hypothetical protein HDU97_005590 [Phlyctochytrium planicorne]|nr:hypothetical protein HDU97_005590 [Phlyctochytrium planicorne]